MTSPAFCWCRGIRGAATVLAARRGQWDDASIHARRRRWSAGSACRDVALSVPLYAGRIEAPGSAASGACHGARTAVLPPRLVSRPVCLASPIGGKVGRWPHDVAGAGRDAAAEHRGTRRFSAFLCIPLGKPSEDRADHLSQCACPDAVPAEHTRYAGGTKPPRARAGPIAERDVAHDRQRRSLVSCTGAI